MKAPPVNGVPEASKPLSDVFMAQSAIDMIAESEKFMRKALVAVDNALGHAMMDAGADADDIGKISEALTQARHSLRCAREHWVQPLAKRINRRAERKAAQGGDS